MPLPLTVSCFSKFQIGFTFLVPAHPGSPEKRAVKRVCVCSSVILYQRTAEVRVRVVASESGRAEVDQSDAATIRVDQHVLILDIAVKHARFVNTFHRSDRLNTQHQRFTDNCTRKATVCAMCISIVLGEMTFTA